jgi:hypothetical protein
LLRSERFQGRQSQTRTEFDVHGRAWRQIETHAPGGQWTRHTIHLVDAQGVRIRVAEHRREIEYR